MSYFTRRKQAFLPTSLLEPTPRTSGNAAEGYVSWQQRDRLIWANANRRNNPSWMLEDDEQDPVPITSYGSG
jgi:hypothetical protein